jgi:hypothetical protein
MARPILDADDHDSTGSVDEGDEASQYVFGDETSRLNWFRMAA